MPGRRPYDPSPSSEHYVKLVPKLFVSTFALAVFATACGAGDASETAAAAAEDGFIVQGEEILADDSTTTTSVAPGAAAGGATEGEPPGFDVTEDTLPQGDEEDPDSEFFSAVGDFFSCLELEGYSFIGIPNRDGDPAEPVNDPGYLAALGDCAALTQIVDKMTAAEDNSGMTAEEIETQNREFNIFVDCLIGRGWTIPTPTPDEFGVLQPPFIEISQTWIPPDGSTLLSDGSLNTDDFVGCGFAPADSTEES
jgi:hypothetical protein